MDITNLTPGQLKKAAAIKEKIEALNRELSKFLGGIPTAARTPRKRRAMSTAAKRKIAAAQRKRWAKIKRRG
jgi:hypothetical protein